jgi:hypothetical protein
MSILGWWVVSDDFPDVADDVSFAARSASRRGFALGGALVD